MLYPALSVTAEVLLVVLSPGDASLTLRKNPTTVHLTDLLNATCRFSFPCKVVEYVFCSTVFRGCMMQGAPAYSPSHPPDKARGWGYRPAKRCRCANRRAGKGPERRPDPSPRRERERERGGGAQGRPLGVAESCLCCSFGWTFLRAEAGLSPTSTPLGFSGP